MNKKTFVQISLSLLIIIVLIFFYLKYFNRKEIVDNSKIDEDIKSDLMEGIEYFSSDVNGNSYIVKADSGQNESENLDLISLYDVKAILRFDKKGQINVTSKKAIYNTKNNNTEFLHDVIVVYQEHNISCDKIIAKFSENYAKLSGNLIYNNISAKLFADQMEIDLFNRTSKTSMINEKDKVKIIKHNGIN
jgi:hypothetical protein